MRPSYEQSASGSATPIYDALCAEYRRLFRALPGDRSEEDELRFEEFGRSPGPPGPGALRLPPHRFPPALPPGSSEPGSHPL
ncbi:hypothetical protein PJ985_16255 [Streptomyces sp. ACA25]|nr:hypothetical protein [Streptomyces sp. ACA25]MDB1089115.1 hypothetical protein [Streptomyces sp. ACA25]